MSDQWPRYEVFRQERADGPHRNVGSVHAADAEMALLNARDVFARRPSCLSLWVVPAAAITTSDGQSGPPDDTPGPLEGYAVCAKQSERQAMTYVDTVGRVEARSPAEALRAAATLAQARLWWVFPERAVGRSDPADASDFAAATGKRFRLPNEYHTVFTMHKIRRGDEAGE